MVTFSAAQSDPWLIDAAVLPLILIPLSFGYSVVRYRLMDVELVVRRVFVYALTTLAIAVAIGAVVYLGGIYALGNDEAVGAGEITLRVAIAIVAMAIIVVIAAPVKNFLQERIDRLFYGERYDMRNGLLDFGRTLSATTALEPLLDALVSRLQQVMNVERVAIFIEDETTPSGYRVARAAGLSAELIVPAGFSRDDSRALCREWRGAHGRSRSGAGDDRLCAALASLLRALCRARAHGGGNRPGSIGGWRVAVVRRRRNPAHSFRLRRGGDRKQPALSGAGRARRRVETLERS